MNVHKVFPVIQMNISYQSSKFDTCTYTNIPTIFWMEKSTYEKYSCCKRALLM